jgi:phosphoglycolate phosphatase-like HAD superfamily hydrolase
MGRQGAVGITQPLDYQDSIWHQDNLEHFKTQEFPEGDIAKHYDDIIFDFDGVLYDSTDAVYYAATLALNHFAPGNEHAELDVADVANSYHSPFQEYYKRFGIDFNDPQVKSEFFRYYIDVCYPEAQKKHPEHFYADAIITLKRLKEEKSSNPNLRIHIVSAKRDQAGRKLLLEAGLIDFLDDIHFEADDKKAAIGEIVLKSQNPNRCIMIGDLPSDIKDAQANDGVRSVAVARGDREAERLGCYLPSYIVNDLEAIFELKSYSKQIYEQN